MYKIAIGRKIGILGKNSIVNGSFTIPNKPKESAEEFKKAKKIAEKQTKEQNFLYFWVNFSKTVRFVMIS